MPPSVLTSDGDVSDAFFSQFSTIICVESRLRGDKSEDIVGPARQGWVVRHLAEVAQAQRFYPQLPTQEMAVNVHAQTPPPAQMATSNPSGYTTPWYANFNLADQGVMNSSGPYRPPAENQYNSRPPNSYRPFDPAELASYRAAVQAQLDIQHDVSATSRPHHYHYYNNKNNNHASAFTFPDYSHSHPYSHSRPASGSRLASTPTPHVRYPFTPPNRPVRHRYRRTPSAEYFPDLMGGSMTPRSKTEPIVESARMSSLAAPDHYEPIEVYAVEVRNGDFIQSVKNPGMCTQSSS